jgi:flagellar hook-basal body complex protein FliE
MAITPVTNPATLATPGAAAKPVEATGDFGASLSAMLESVESTAGVANAAIAAMTAGTGDVHTAMLALHRAEVSMQLTVQVRNKLVQAYQDLMRMPI